MIKPFKKTRTFLFVPLMFSLISSELAAQQVIIIQPAAPSGFDFWDKKLKEKQGQYDEGFTFCKKQYDDLMEVLLINLVNKAKIEQYQTTVKTWLQQNTNIDYSLSANVNGVSAFINQWKNDPDLVYEWKVIHINIDRIINGLIQTNPNDFESVPRYISLQKAMNEIIHCTPKDIAGIVSKYNL